MLAESEIRGLHEKYGQSTFTKYPGQIFVTHFPNSSIHMARSAIISNSPIGDEPIDGAIRPSETDTRVVLLDDVANDAMSDLATYTLAIGPLLHSQEQSPYMSATLSIASELSTARNVSATKPTAETILPTPHQQPAKPPTGRSPRPSPRPLDPNPPPPQHLTPMAHPHSQPPLHPPPPPHPHPRPTPRPHRTPRLNPQPPHRTRPREAPPPQPPQPDLRDLPRHPAAAQLRRAHGLALPDLGLPFTLVTRKSCSWCVWEMGCICMLTNLRTHSGPSPNFQPTTSTRPRPSRTSSACCCACAARCRRRRCVRRRGAWCRREGATRWWGGGLRR